MERTDSALLLPNVEALDHHIESDVSSRAASSHGSDDAEHQLGHENDRSPQDIDLGDLPEMMNSVLSVLRGETGAFENFQRRREEKYLASRDTPERLAKSQAKISELTGFEPDRPPIQSPSNADDQIARNGAFTTFWLPWAQQAQYVAETDIDLSASTKYGIEVTQKLRTVVHNLMSWAIPSPPVLELISTRAESIIEVGAGTGYWAALLADRGCDVLAVDVEHQPIQWHPIHQQGKSS